MAEPDVYTVPRWGAYPSEAPERASIRRSCVINYSLVWVHTGDFAICPSPEGPLGIGYDKIAITAFPPDDSTMDRIVQPNSGAAIISRPNTADNDTENDQARHDMVYTYGDPNQWTPFLSCSTGSGTVDDPHKFEMRITERDFIAEQSNYEGLRTVALEALKILDDESNFIVEDASGDAVLDDNGNKMLFMKVLVRELEPWEPWVFYFKRLCMGRRRF